MSFYSIVFTITTVIAILALTVIGILMMFGKAAIGWPPDVPQCPDWWTVSGGKKSGGQTCTADAGLGNVGSANCGPFVPDTLFGAIVPGAGQQDANSPRCQRQQWARKCGVYWDGITGIPCNFVPGTPTPTPPPACPTPAPPPTPASPPSAPNGGCTGTCDGCLGFCFEGKCMGKRSS